MQPRRAPCVRGSGSQSDRHFLGRLPALRRRPKQRPVDDLSDFGWQVRRPISNGRSFVANSIIEQLNDRVAVLRQDACQQLVEHDAARVHIGLWAELATLGLLGSHVRRGSKHLAVAGRHGFFTGQHLCDSEIGDLDLAIIGEHQVLGLDVSVQHTSLMRMLHARRRRQNQPNGLCRLDSFVQEAVPEGSPRKLFHYEC